MYRIHVEPVHALVTATLEGMMSVEEVGAYAVDLRRHLSVHRLGPDYRIIVDVAGCPIQSQAMMQAMGVHMATMPKARAIAVVAGGSLARMQARRLFTQPYCRLVETMPTARAWVLHGIEPPARAA